MFEFAGRKISAVRLFEQPQRIYQGDGARRFGGGDGPNVVTGSGQDESANHWNNREVLLIELNGAVEVTHGLVMSSQHAERLPAILVAINGVALSM